MSKLFFIIGVVCSCGSLSPMVRISRDPSQEALDSLIKDQKFSAQNNYPTTTEIHALNLCVISLANQHLEIQTPVVAKRFILTFFKKYQNFDKNDLRYSKEMIKIIDETLNSNTEAESD